MTASIKLNINKYVCFLIGFLLPMALQVPGINLYYGEALLFFFITYNAQRFVNFIRTAEQFKTVWVWNYFLVIFIALYGFFVGDLGLHGKAALQYGVCLLIVLPAFCFLIVNYEKSTLYGIYLGLLSACFFLFQAFHFDLYLFKEVFNYNVTGGIFKRVGMTSVNDYAIMLLVCSLTIISFESRTIIKLFFLLVTFYLVLLTGSRIGILGFLFLIILTKHKVPLSLSIKLIVFMFFVTLVLFSYEHIDGLQRLVQNGLNDGERKNLRIEGIDHLSANPWGPGLLQYFDPKNG